MLRPLRIWRGDTAQFTSTLWDCKAKRKRQSRHKLVIGNYNITSLRGKENELIEEAKLCSRDVAGIPSTKRRDSDPVELDDAWIKTRTKKTEG